MMGLKSNNGDRPFRVEDEQHYEDHKFILRVRKMIDGAAIAIGKVVIWSLIIVVAFAVAFAFKVSGGIK